MIEQILQIAGAVVPLLSALSSLVNHIVRGMNERGDKPAPALLATGAVLNAGAINVDKAVQLANMLRAKPPPAGQ